MKKLNKQIALATEYQAWFPKRSTRVYNSSTNKYYHDVLYELLIIQSGLCAYTEFRLVSVENLEFIKGCFLNGKLNIEEKPSIPAD
jgi:hypothetical protein